MNSARKAPTQLRMWEKQELGLDRAFANTRRVDLDSSSWVEHIPGWLTRNDLLLDSLAESAGWEQRKRWMFTKLVAEPRLTAEYRILAEAPSPVLREIGQALSERFGVVYDSAWLNLYRDHRDSTAWHADRPYGKRDHCIVPVLSLGATRRFSIRHRDGGHSTTFVVEGGDLVVMGGRCQRDWVHAVPKETRPAGMRVSVNFGSSEQMIPE
jgi:hypothetical protein